MVLRKTGECKDFVYIVGVNPHHGISFFFVSYFAHSIYYANSNYVAI